MVLVVRYFLTRGVLNVDVKVLGEPGNAITFELLMFLYEADRRPLGLILD